MALRLFENLERNLFKEMRNLESQFFDNRYSNTLSYNHRTTDKNHYYEVDLPGLKKEDLKIKVDKNNRTLNISGNRKNSYEKDGKYKVKQISYGEFYRSFPLERDVDLNSVKAAFKDGVLVVAFNRIEQDKIDPNLLTVNLDD